jgi:hypothetical protein
MYLRVEDYIDLNDKTIKWYDIPNYNGYQISTTGHIRSLKHYKKYPFGILIKHKNNLFTLTNSNNIRTTVSYNEIVNLVKNSEYSLSYPKDTNTTSYSSRNNKCFILS